MKKRLKKLVKIFLVVFFTPFLLAFVLTLAYVVIPPLSIPVVEHVFSGKDTYWRWRSYDEISPNLSRMVVSAEDDRFCLHNGVDWQAVEKVAAKAEKHGKLSRGASTISMQVAKNLFLWPLPNIIRKPLEVPLAMWMDWVWGKKRMMEVYMNIAEFGNGVYGAEAASREYFHKTAAQIDVNEAAALASILPAPERRDPDNPTRKTAHYAAVIKSRAGYGLVSCLR